MNKLRHSNHVTIHIVSDTAFDKVKHLCVYVCVSGVYMLNVCMRCESRLHITGSVCEPMWKHASKFESMPMCPNVVMYIKNVWMGETGTLMTVFRCTWDTQMV